jgi:hypothetical protein
VATCTIVVTQNTDKSVNVTSTDAASFNLFIPNETRQSKRIEAAIGSVIQSVLTLNQPDT